MIYIIQIEKGEYRTYQTMILDGVEFGFAIDLNPVDKYFVLTVDRTGEFINDGVRIVAGINLLSINSNSKQPPGELYVYDLDAADPKQGREPTIDNFGDRLQLAYDDGK